MPFIYIIYFYLNWIRDNSNWIWYVIKKGRAFDQSEDEVCFNALKTIFILFFLVLVLLFLFQTHFMFWYVSCFELHNSFFIYFHVVWVVNRILHLHLVNSCDRILSGRRLNSTLPIRTRIQAVNSVISFATMEVVFRRWLFLTE